MTPYQYFFDVPAHIATGLSSGVLERVGGVIRDTASKQVVAWLRDAPAMNAASGLPTPLNIIMNLAKTAVAIQDGRMTRSAVAGVSQQVTAASGQLTAVTALSNFVAVGQVVNFGLTAVSLTMTLQRLNQLSDEIGQLEQTVQNEFNRDRDMIFKVALQKARDVFEGEPSAYSKDSVHSAIYGLFEARDNFLTDLNDALKSNSPQRLFVAGQHFVRATYAEAIRIRCYMMSDGVETALRRLREDLPRFRDAASRLVSESLGAKPALYFYKDVPDETLERFIQVYRWCISPDDASAVSFTAAMLAALHQFRADFWKPVVIQDDYRNALDQAVRRLPKTLAAKIAELPDALANAEMIIENFQHLLGFDLELRSIPLSAEEWQNYIPEAELEEHGFGMIVDDDALQHALERLAS